MDALWTLYEVGLGCFQAFLTVAFLDRVLTRKGERWWGWAAMLGMSAALGSYVFFEMPQVDTWVFLPVLVYVLCCFADKLWLRLFWLVMVIVAFNGVVTLCITLFTGVMGHGYAFLLRPGALRLVFTLTCNLAACAALFLLAQLRRFKLGSTLPLLLFAALNALTVLMVDFLFAIYEDVGVQQTWILAGGVICMGISVLSIALYILLSRMAQREFESKQAAETLKAQMRRSEELRGVYASLHGLRHDLKNHLGAARTMFAQGKAEEGIRYLDGVERDLFSVFSTGCLPLDSLLTLKEMELRRKNIGFAHRLCKTETLPIEDYELCAILGNLLDNAAEAIERHGSRTPDMGITLTMTLVRGMLCIECENPCDETTLRKHKEDYLTSKQEKDHGTGLRNIRAITARARGIADFTQENGAFRARIALPLHPRASHIDM